MSDPVDEHLNKAFACLDDVPARELYATARALERRATPWQVLQHLL